MFFRTCVGCFMFLATAFMSTIVGDVKSSSPKIIAHRGFSKEAPENTLSAFSKALQLNVYAIEFDVHLTKEGIPIVVHDGRFGRTTDGAFLQKTTDLSLAEIKSLDVGSWYNQDYQGEQMPTLDEVLEQIQGAVTLMVEIKTDNSPPQQIVQAVIASLEKMDGQYVIASFDPNVIAEVMSIAPQYPVLGLVEQSEMYNVFTKLGVKHLGVWYELLNEDILRLLHDQGIEVWTFTVDNPNLAKHLSSIGVDGIISNDPVAMLKFLK